MEEEENGGSITYSNPQSNENEQIGLVNANAQLNVSIFSNGTAAGGTAALGAGTAAYAGTATAGATTGLAATGFAQALPVIGQVVAVVAACVSVVQMFDTAQKQANMVSGIKNAKEQAILMQQELDVIDLQGSQELQILKEDIAYRELALENSKKRLTISASVLGLGAMVFAYSVIKLRK